jgi:hypothetical protein
MTDLKERIEYFLDLREKITQGEWVIESRLTQNMTDVDIEAMSKIPQALDLIAELAKEKTQKYEYQYKVYENKIVWRLNNRAEDLKKSVNDLRKNNVALKEENTALKQRIQELEKNDE